jgi:protein-S-isoprenylcysteine O-methyltransferase Ste14
MDTEQEFRIAFACLFVSVFLIRAYYNWMAGIARRRPERGQQLDDQDSTRGTWIFLVVCLCLMYMIVPNWLGWASVPLWPELRWAAAGIAALSVVLLIWTHHALGKHFSTSLSPPPDHALVTHGPYRWVRHPMYAAMILLWLCLSVLSANWLLFLLIVLAIVRIVRVRAPFEEALMLKTYGDAYRDYVRGTGRYLPALGRKT